MTGFAVLSHATIFFFDQLLLVNQRAEVSCSLFCLLAAHRGGNCLERVAFAIGVVLVEGFVHRSVRLDGAINASPPEQRTEPHFLRPTTDQKPGWSYLHRGNPRRFSLNTPNKIVRLKLKKDQP